MGCKEWTALQSLSSEEERDQEGKGVSLQTCDDGMGWNASCLSVLGFCHLVFLESHGRP